MPLSRGCSRAVFQENLETLLHEGYPLNQVLAICYRTRRDAGCAEAMTGRSPRRQIARRRNPREPSDAWREIFSAAGRALGRRFEGESLRYREERRSYPRQTWTGPAGSQVSAEIDVYVPQERDEEPSSWRLQALAIPHAGYVSPWEVSGWWEHHEGYHPERAETLPEAFALAACAAVGLDTVWAEKLEARSATMLGTSRGVLVSARREG